MLALNAVNRRSNELVEEKAEDATNMECIDEVVVSSLDNQVALLSDDELDTSVGFEIRC